MAKKSKNIQFSQAQLKALRTLKEKGLYKPKDGRKKTRYAKTLLKRFADVLGGNAAVVETNAEVAGRYRDKKSKSGEIRSAGKKVIVPKLPGERASFNKKRGEVDVSRTMKTGERYVRSPFRNPPKSYDELKNQLGEKDRIAVAYYRGVKNPVEWQYFDDVDFYNTFIGGYSGSNGNKEQEKALAWALKHSMVSRLEMPKKRKAK